MLKDSQITIFRFLLKKKGPIKTPKGNFPCPRLCKPEILNTPPVSVAIEIEALKSSRQAIDGDYLLLSYLLQSKEKI